MGTESIWVIIACDEALDKQRDQIDSGYFAEAKETEFQLKSLAEKLESLIGQKGGQLHISTLDRQVLEVPLTVAEELPNLLQGFKAFFKTRMAVGMGLTMREAGKATWVSKRTNEIEMFDPEDEKFSIDLITKNDVILPPNLFDPSKPVSPEPEMPQPAKFRPGLDAKQSLAAETELINGIIQQLSGPAEEAQKQMQAQQQQQQQAEEQQQQQDETGNDGQPRDLMEALHGKQIEGRPEEKPGKTESKSKSKDTDEDEKSSDSEDSDEDSEDGEGDGKLAELLASVGDRVSKLQGLAETNPEAFKKVITLVHKLVDMAKQKKVKKHELFDLTEELNKVMKYPVGTVKNRRKKVMVNGKAVWRSVISGQVKDAKGQAISVRSSNAQAASGEMEKPNE